MPQWSRFRLLRWAVGAALAVALASAVWMLDRMALAYTTGFRRAPAQTRGAPAGGPAPGVAFLGFSSPWEDGDGFVMRRVSVKGRDAGLAPGDLVAAVDGAAYSGTREAMDGLRRTRLAGDEVLLDLVRGGRELRLPLRLDPWIRHPGDLGLAWEDVEIPSDSGHLLRGWWMPPPANSDGRSVAWVHGAHSSRFQALEQAGGFLLRRGYGVLTMDLSGRGTSEGTYITYTMNERHDVRAMVEWLRGRPDADANRVTVFGTSNGAASAIYAAAALGDVPALVLDAPYGDLWDAAGTMLSSRGGSLWLRGPLALAVRARTGLRLRSVRPLDEIARIPGPVLFIHGDRDRQVPPEHSEAMHEARRAAGLPSVRWVIPGGEHGFDSYPPRGLFWNRVADFLDDALGGRPAGRELSDPPESDPSAPPTQQ